MKKFLALLLVLLIVIINGNVLAAEKTIVEPSLIELSGEGQKASQKFVLEIGLSIFQITHSGKSHFGVFLMDRNGKKIELLANVIGDFDGSKAVGIREKGDYVLDISADGKWTVKISQPKPTDAEGKPRTFTGIGQQVSPFIKLEKGLVIFKLKHSGKSHFGVFLIDRNGKKIELLANVIGDFDGSKAVGISNPGLYIMDISADGEWTISVE